MFKTAIDEVLEKALKLNDASAWLFAMNDEQTKLAIKRYIYLQLDKGEDEDGNIIGVYSQATENITDGRKKAGTPYDLLETGYFRRSFSVLINPNEIIIDADGQKPDKNLLSLYGYKILGLTEENMSNLREIVQNKYLEYVRNVFFNS
jgi:hypothetical protein